MSQTYLAKTTIESGESANHNYWSKLEIRKQRRANKKISKLENNEDDSKHQVKPLVYSRKEKFTDKLGALKRWIVSCDGMHIDEFWSKVNEKFSTAGGYTALDHVKIHIKGYIFDTEDPRYHYETQGKYSPVIIDKDRVLRKNNSYFHREKPEYMKSMKVTTFFNADIWKSAAKGRVLDCEGSVWYWYDVSDLRRVARVSENDLVKVREALGTDFYDKKRWDYWSNFNYGNNKISYKTPFNISVKQIRVENYNSVLKEEDAGNKRRAPQAPSEFFNGGKLP